MHSLLKLSPALPLALCLFHSPALGGDWAFWRGPNLNGASTETGLPSTWSPEGENLLWKAPFGCRSTPIVFNNRVYLIGRAGEGVHEKERVVCLNASNGALVWEDRFSIYLTNVPNARVGWANLLGDPKTGYVYAHGVGGVFRCYDRDGKVLWSHSLTERFGRMSGYGGRTNSPVIHENLIILGFTNSSWGPFNRPSHRYWAFDKLTGENVYVAAPAGTFKNSTYSTPIVVNAGGANLLVDANSDGHVYALKVLTGETVWKYRLSSTALHCSVVHERGKIYATQGEEVPEGGNIRGRLVCLDAATGKEEWRHDGIRAGYASPGVYQGNVYVIDNSGLLHCVAAGTGKFRWSHQLGTVGKGSPTFGDGKCYATTVDGRLSIIEVGDEGGKALSTVELKVKVLDGSPRPSEVYGTPAISNGRVFFPSEEALYCIGKPRSSASASASVTVSGTVTVVGAREATHLRVSPGEGLAVAGKNLTFKASVFDESGRFIKLVEPEWALLGLKGSVTPSGVFSTPRDSGSQAGMVQAKWQDLTAKVRLRVVASAPFTEDFESYQAGKAPSWFVGAGKFNLAQLDGNMKLHKPVPKKGLARSYAYISAPEMKGYTVQADLMVREYKRRMSDAGVINCRYVVDLVGNHQKIQIRTWPGSAPPRFQVDKPFRWDPDVWYRMKVRVDPTDSDSQAARVRAKVWKVADPEPNEWTIDEVDASGNLEGAPGISGYNDRADVYFDNIVVTPSE